MLTCAIEEQWSIQVELVSKTAFINVYLGKNSVIYGSKTWVCGRSLAGIAGSNPGGYVLVLKYTTNLKERINVVSSSTPV
jgi:hypothetical protein